MTWPHCPYEVTLVLYDTPVHCDLPKGHEMDGEPEHYDRGKGVHWTTTTSWLRER